MGRPVRTEPFDLGKAVREEAWRLIRTDGIEAVTLRGIARALNITAPAIYNYFPSLEDLHAALAEEADAHLGRYLTDAHTPHLEDDPQVQFRVVCQAYRRWGMEDPHRYRFLFSATLSKKDEVSHTLKALIAILNRAQETGGLKKEEHLVLPPGLSALLTEWKGSFDVRNEYVLYLATIVWSRLHGLILNEIGQRHPPYIKDAGELFRLEVKTMLYQYFIQ